MTETTTYMQQESDMEILVTQLFKAFKFFNRELWSGMLPPCSIQIGEKRGARGVFKPNYFVPKDIAEAIDDDAKKMHEILMNPVDFVRPEIEILGTFVHEMVHMWEEEYGRPGKNGYHNKHWAESMKAVGLYPSTTGQPGGKETGRKVSHYIIEGGLFEQLAHQFIEEHDFKVDWVVVERSRTRPTPRKRTYRCDCPQPVYANLSGRKLMCLDCGKEFEEDDL